MRAGLRILLIVAPPLVGLLVVAASTYIRQSVAEIRATAIVVALIFAVGSAGWAVFAARRITGRSASAARGAPRGTGAKLTTSEPTAASDELSEITPKLDRSTDATESASLAATERSSAVEAPGTEYQTLLSHTASVMADRLEAIRLPLYILLQGRFGEINENQEELVAAAKGAADAAGSEVEAVRRIVDLDRGAVPFHPEPIRPIDVLQPLLSVIAPRSEAAGVSFNSDIPPTLPHVCSDRARLREALELLLSDALHRSSAGDTFTVTAERSGDSVRISIGYGAGPEGAIALPLARRLLSGNETSIEHEDRDVGGKVFRLRLPVVTWRKSL